MSTFLTPQPITVVVEAVAGSVRLVASDRDDTVVDVQPRDPNRASDVRIAEQARVDFHDGTLTVTAGRRFISLGRGGAVAIAVALPTASRLRVSTASATLHAEGGYSDCRFASSSGDVTVESVAGDLTADSASGDVSVGNVSGDVSISTASGDATIGRLGGDATFRAASGRLTVHQLHGDVTAQTASGDVTLGVPHGTAARLDLRTGSGAVRNALEASDGPAAGDERIDVHVHTASGDVTVRRATADAVVQIEATADPSDR